MEWCDVMDLLKCHRDAQRTYLLGHSLVATTIINTTPSRKRRRKFLPPDAFVAKDGEEVKSSRPTPDQLKLKLLGLPITQHFNKRQKKTTPITQ